MKVEGVIHLNTLESTLGVVFSQLGENVNLQLCRIPILLDVANNFNCNNFVLAHILALHNLAKRSLSQLFQHFVPESNVSIERSIFFKAAFLPEKDGNVTMTS
jgi:hypothetical protein